MNIDIRRLCFLGVIVLSASFSWCTETMAKPLQKPAWVNKYTWIQPPLFDMKRGFSKDQFSIAEPGNIENGLLRCRVRVSEDLNLDTWGRPELRFYIKAGENPHVTFDGPDSRSTAWFYEKLNQLNVNDNIRIHVVDRDLRSEDSAGYIDVTYDGERTIESESEFLDIRCIIMNSDSLEKHVQDQAGRLQQYIQQHKDEFLLVNADAYDFGLQKNEIMKVRERIFGLAALTGWQSPVVGKAVKSHAEIMLPWKAAVSASIASRLLNNPQALTPVVVGDTGIEMFVKAYECGDSVPQKYAPLRSSSNRDALLRSQCTVTINIKNITKKELPLGSVNTSYGEITLITIVAQNGMDVPLIALGFTENGTPLNLIERVILQPGESTIAVMTPDQQVEQAVFIRPQDFFKRQHVLINVP